MKIAKHRLAQGAAALALAVSSVLFGTSVAEAGSTYTLVHTTGTGGANAFGQTVWYLSLNNPKYIVNGNFSAWGTPYVTPKVTIGWTASGQKAAWDTTASTARWSHGSATFKYLALPYVGALQTRYPYLTLYTKR